ncbi:hypothetical protein ACFQY0_08860 [Haloferula chungangensis]|uniref:Uncharacterized protein n=2 Tax=Haloferula chungangensis TaxID=1048331 RepID=A0ABW2L4P2_9BACT
MAEEPGKVAKSERTLEDYSAWYGKSQRTIKRWRQMGVQKRDLCPLDDPAALVGWWLRHQRQRVPVGILRAAKLAGQSLLNRFTLERFEGDGPPTSQNVLGWLEERSVSWSISGDEEKGLGVEMQLGSRRCHISNIEPDDVRVMLVRATQIFAGESADEKYTVNPNLWKPQTQN